MSYKRKMFGGADHLIFQKAKEFRKSQTDAEEILWNYLKTRPYGFKFRRQHPFACYVVDFYCHRLKLVIEVDGSIHNREDVKKNDKIRQMQLEQSGLQFLRFNTDDILTKPEIIMNGLNEYLRTKKTNNIKTL